MPKVNRAAATGALSAASALGALALAGRAAAIQVGGRPRGDRLARMESSPRFVDGAFHNTDPSLPAYLPGRQADAVLRFAQSLEGTRPATDVPLAAFAGPAPTTRPSATWLGHASVLLELDGARLLLDPIWSLRASPSQGFGPKRLHRPPLGLREVGHIDAVVISHDHYDHLDMDTIRELDRTTSARFIVPLGVGAHLERWRVHPTRIVECDWGESASVGPLTLTAVEAQHFSGRAARRDETLWASWVIAGPSGRVFFSGDSGYFDRYASIGSEFGGFDLSLMAVGAYDDAWPHVHLTPEQAITAAGELGSALVLPIHWATFALAPHPWAEPIERTYAAAAAHGTRLAIPRPGERVDADHPRDPEPWWQPDT